MMSVLAFSLALGALARAEAPVVFAQDPLCANPPDFFREELNKARPLHLKYPQLRANAEDQNKWFAAVSGEMKDVCDSDAKFALALVSKDRSELTGQCKPAAEVALADQEVLEHSEASLKRLQDKRAAFLLKGEKGGVEGLWNIFEKDYYRVDVDALDLMDVPREAACELRWVYPQSFLKLKVPFTGCPDAPPGMSLGDWDKKDAGIFAQMMTRYNLSIDYNTTRRNNALASALASKGRYEACVAQYPGTENVLTKAKSAHGQGSARAVPQGKASGKGSDITGVQEDEAKQKK
ncbi:MAG: hypothetical protein ACXVB9_08790 [Bdellovibrionota bacterium]